MKPLLPWIVLAALGAYHGLNPAMGWLFAVSRGLQERSTRAVLASLPPIALGHAASIAATVLLLALGDAAFSGATVRVGLSIVVIGFGLLKLLRPRHPRWVGMRVGFRDLTLWSFMMATAHGAGLMLIPVFLAGEAGVPCTACSVHAGLVLRSWPGYASAVVVHTTAMFVVAGAVALVVFRRLGLGLLRRAWFNLDVAWALALMASGAVALAT